MKGITYKIYSKCRKLRTETSCLTTETRRLIFNIKLFSAHIAWRLTCTVWRLHFTIGRIDKLTADHCKRRTSTRTPSNRCLKLFPITDNVSVVIQGVLVQILNPYRNRRRVAMILITAAASEPGASEQGSNSNLYMWVKFCILPLARCIMVPVGFYHNAARSVALKCTCVVAVWSFFHCFDFREDTVSFQAEKFWRFSGEFFMIMFGYFNNIYLCYLHII